MWYEFSMKEAYILAGAVNIAMEKYKEISNRQPHLRSHMAMLLVELQEISRRLYDEGHPNKPK